MNAELLHTLKESLEKEKRLIEQELADFATKDKKASGNWKSSYPRVPEGNEEEAADEVEEYEERISVEQKLETRLKEINAALLRISQGSYGTCKTCGKEVEKERLMAAPSARTCEHCLD